MFLRQRLRLDRILARGVRTEQGRHDRSVEALLLVFVVTVLLALAGSVACDPVTGSVVGGRPHRPTGSWAAHSASFPLLPSVLWERRWQQQRRKPSTLGRRPIDHTEIRDPQGEDPLDEGLGHGQSAQALPYRSAFGNLEVAR